MGIAETPDGVPPITGVPTSIGLFVGWAPSGPADGAVRLKNFSDYERNFGHLDPRSLLGYAVHHFYGNGGSDAYVLRIDVDASGPNDGAFLASLRAAFATGGPVDRIDRFNLVCVPGLTEAASIAMLQAYAGRRRAFLIADCAEDATVATIAASLAGKTGADARNAALYFPWVTASDPARANAIRAFPPCGFVAGVLARFDADPARGVWKAPAGIDAKLNAAAGLAVTIDETESSALNAQAVNTLRIFPGSGPVVWSARTLAAADAGASDWIYIPVRRLAIYLEQSIAAGTQWAVFEPNNEALWGKLRRAVGAFMDGLYEQGAFAGTRPADAYFVKCDSTTTTQADIDRGVVNIVIGYALLGPAEFVLITIAQFAAANG